MSVMQGVAGSSAHAAEPPSTAQHHPPTPIPSPPASRSSSPAPGPTSAYKIAPLPSPTPSPYPSRPATPTQHSRAPNAVLNFRPATRDVLRAIVPHVFLESAPGMQNILARQAGLPPRAYPRYGRRRGWPRRNPTRALTARCDGLRARDAMHARGLRYDPRRPLRGSPLRACTHLVIWEDFDEPAPQPDVLKTEKTEKRRSWKVFYSLRNIRESLGQLASQRSRATLRPGLPKSQTEPALSSSKPALSTSKPALSSSESRTPRPESRTSLPESRTSLPESTPRPPPVSTSLATSAAASTSPPSAFAGPPSSASTPPPTPPSASTPPSSYKPARDAHKPAGDAPKPARDAPEPTRDAPPRPSRKSMPEGTPRPAREETTRPTRASFSETTRNTLARTGSTISRTGSAISRTGSTLSRTGSTLSRTGSTISRTTSTISRTSSRFSLRGSFRRARTQSCEPPPVPPLPAQAIAV